MSIKSEAGNTGTGNPTGAIRQERSTTDLFHRIYDPEALAQAIRLLAGDASDPDDFSTEGSAVDSPEDRNRLQWLRRIAADPRGPRRRSIVGSPVMMQRIASLSAAMPHFAPAIDLIARAALVSTRTATPLRLPPVLLLGEAGCGKSYTGRCLAEAIGGDGFDRNAFALLSCNMMDQFRLRGQNVGWRGARMGRIAEILLAASTNPVVLVDEFDKASTLSAFERPYDIWHSLLDCENSNYFRDDFLEIELRADTILFFASANDISALPMSIVDRFLIFEISPPSREQLSSIVTSLYAACRNSYGNRLPTLLSDDVLEELSRHSLRRISQVLQLALGYAVENGRLRISVGDVRSAQALADYTRFPNRLRQIGFVPRHHG